MGKKNMFSSISQWDFGVAANWTLINFLKTQLSSNSYLLCCLVTKLCPTLLKPQELEPTRLFGPLGFLGKSAGGGCHFLLQGILPVHELNLSLVSSALAGRHFTTAPLGKPLFYLYLNINMSNSVQFLSHDWLFATPWTAASQALLSFINSWSLLKLMPREFMMPPTITSSVVPFSSCLQSFAASGSFPISQFFASCGQSIGVSASASVLPVNIQDWFPLGLTDFISLQYKGLSRVLFNTILQTNSSVLSFLHGTTLTSKRGPLEKRMTNSFIIHALKTT